MQKSLTLFIYSLMFMTCIIAQNVGIGTSLPFNKLHVKQDIPNKAIEWEHENRIDNWTIGIGTNTLNCRFEFNNTLKGSISSVDGSFLTASDFRLKENIEPVHQLLPKILQLKAYKYFFKDSHHLTKNKSLGFIAQDVEKIFPEMVYNMDGGMKGINYSAFAIVAIKAIQEQQQYILDQQKTIYSLEDRLLKLEITFANHGH